MANRTTLINEKLDNIVECCICIEPLTDPRILPCYHTFCVGCLKEIGLKAKKGPGDKMPCPQCRAEFTVPFQGILGLQKNFFMDKLLEVINLSSKQNVCDFSTGGCGPVKWYCEECTKMLCDRCYKLHKTHKGHDCIRFKNHTDTLQHLEISQPKFCEQHEKEKLKIFCTDCHVVLCTFCFLENHQPHKWSKVREAAEMVRTNMIRNIDMLVNSVSKIRDITEENNIALLDSVNKIESTIKMKKLQVKALLEKILDEDESSLLERLDSLTHGVLSQIELKKEEIAEHETKLTSYIMSCNDITANGSDVDICRAAMELDLRARELKDSLGTVMDRKPTKFDISFKEMKSADFLKSRLGNWHGKIEGGHDECPAASNPTTVGNHSTEDDTTEVLKSDASISAAAAETAAHQDTANAQKQQSVMFSQQNPKMIVQNMQYMPYMVPKGTMMSAQPPPTPQQSAAIRQTMMMPPRFSSPMPQYQQHQQQQQQPQTGFVQHEQQQYSMLPPESNYHMAAAPNIHPAYYQAMQVQQQVQQRSDGSMPGNAPPPQVYATGSQIQQQNPQPWQMYQQPPSMPRFQPMVSVRFPQQMPMQRTMAPSMQQQPVGMPQEMPTEVVARPPMHVGEPAQRPQFITRQQRSDIVYYDPLKAGNDVEDKASQATKPKAKSILSIIDSTTGQNVLETLKMSSRQTSNEALKIQSEFAHKVTQRISLGDKAPNFESRPAQPLHGDGPVNLLATAPAYEIQPLGMKHDDGLTSASLTSAGQEKLEHFDQIREELTALLMQHKDNQPIFEWIQKNVTPVEAKTREFIRALVTAVCTRAIMASETSSNAQSASYSVSEVEIISRQTLLQRHLDHKPDREIQALYALQALVHSLEHPSNILHSFFNILYDQDIITEEAFWEWQSSTDPAEQSGKGVARQSVRPFFDWLSEGTEETTGS